MIVNKLMGLYEVNTSYLACVLGVPFSNRMQKV